MNESQSPTPVTENQPVTLVSPTPDSPQQAIAQKDSFALGLSSLIVASVAFLAPLSHWLVILSMFGQSRPLAETYGGIVLGLVATVALEWILLPTAGLVSLIIGIIAVTKGGRGRTLGFIALGINLLIVLAVIAQNIYWGVITS